MKKAAFIKRSGRGDFSADVTVLQPATVESKWAAYANGRFIPIDRLGKPVVVSKLRQLAIPVPKTPLEIAATLIVANYIEAEEIHADDQMPPFGM